LPETSALFTGTAVSVRENGWLRLAASILELPRYCLGDCERWELSERRLDNLRESFAITIGFAIYCIMSLHVIN
jgi:hypothetical protein